MTIQTQQSTPVVTQSFMNIVMGAVVIVVLIAWAASFLRRAIKGEEVEYPFSSPPMVKG